MLPGAILYGGMAVLLITNADLYLQAVPAVALSFGSAYLLRPLVVGFGQATGRKVEIPTAFQPAFFRFYLDGSLLGFAYAFNYLAVGLAGGGFLLLLIAGLFS